MKNAFWLLGAHPEIDARAGLWVITERGGRLARRDTPEGKTIPR